MLESLPAPGATPLMAGVVPLEPLAFLRDRLIPAMQSDGHDSDTIEFLQSIVDAHVTIDFRVASRLERSTGFPGQFWLNLQKAFNLAEQVRLGLVSPEALARLAAGEDDGSGFSVQMPKGQFSPGSESGSSL